MPGSVANASPAAVMPAVGAKAFTESREVASRNVEYRGGTRERMRLVDTSRRRWTITRLLTATELAALRTFWDTVRHGEFYFYHPKETVPAGSWDGSGTAVAGRYTVRFEGAWAQTTNMTRSEVGLSLVEVA